MKVYKFRCKGCGSHKYEKLNEHQYKCKYCGGIEEVTPKEDPKPTVQEDVHHDDKCDECNVQPMTLEEVHLIRDFFIVLLFGYLGVHKFMKGRIVLGFIYLFTHGLFGIGYIIDIVNAVLNMVHSRKNHDNDIY